MSGGRGGLRNCPKGEDECTRVRGAIGDVVIHPILAHQHLLIHSPATLPRMNPIQRSSCAGKCGAGTKAVLSTRIGGQSCVACVRRYFQTVPFRLRTTAFRLRTIVFSLRTIISRHCMVVASFGQLSAISGQPSSDLGQSSHAFGQSSHAFRWQYPVPVDCPPPPGNCPKTNSDRQKSGSGRRNRCPYGERLRLGCVATSCGGPHPASGGPASCSIYGEKNGDLPKSS